MSLRRLVRPALESLRAYVPPPAPRIKLDANESPWPLPEEARAHIAAHVAALELHRYPDPRATRLRLALAARHGGAPDDYVVGAGSDEVLSLLMIALSAPRDGAQPAVLVPTPTFVMYRHGAVVQGLAPIEIPLMPDTFALDVPAMRGALREHRPGLVFLASPNNPTGNPFLEADVEALATSDPDALFVVDEAYGPYCSARLTHLADRHPNVALLGTLSKIGLAGARVGWARLPAELAAEVDKARQPFNVSSLSLAIGELALGDLAPLLEAHVALVIEERARLVRELAAIPGVHPHPTQANFVLTRFDDAEATVRALREHDIGVRIFGDPSPTLRGTARITVGTPPENDALLAVLRHL